MNSRSFFLSALIAGAVIGVLGNLPLLNLINCIFCIFAWLGGALAVWLYRRYQPAGPALSLAQGAGLGALAGLIGAVIGLLVYLIVSPLMNSLFTFLYQTLQVQGENPFQAGGNPIVPALIFFVLDALFYTLFGAVGALIATNLMWKRPAAA